MKSTEKWFQMSKEFFKNVGLNRDDRLLDFGCGAGNYSIAAAMYISKDGEIYALDKSRRSLQKLRKRSEERNLNNIEIIKKKVDSELPFENNYFDFVLLYDVIHSLKNRKNIYRDIHKILRDNGTLSIYPTHYRSKSLVRRVFGRDLNLDLDAIIREVEEQGFSLQKTLKKELIHSRSLVEGEILNFERMSSK